MVGKRNTIFEDDGKAIHTFVSNLDSFGLVPEPGFLLNLYADSGSETRPGFWGDKEMSPQILLTSVVNFLWYFELGKLT